MRKLVLASFVLFAGIWANAQVEFRQVLSSEDMDKVWADAESQNKVVFVDIYATWCGPCKWLDANVFATEAAGEYMNEKFINVKLDGESEFGRVFAMKSGLSAYPSLFLFNAQQKLMNMLVGAKPWEELQPAFLATLEYFPVLEMLQTKFEADLLKKEEYPRFTLALREMGKEDYGYAVADKYMKDFVNGDQRTIEDIQVLAFYTEPKTDSWSNLFADIPTLTDALGADLEGFVEHSINISIELAVENSDVEYISDLVEILPEITKGTTMDPAEMESRLYVYFYHYSDRIDDLIEYIDREYKENHSGDHNWLFSSASNAVFLDPQNTPVAEKGLEWFKECLDLKETQEYYYHLALCQYFTNSPDLAIKSLQKSLEFTEDQEIIETTNSIIEQVQAEISEE